MSYDTTYHGNESRPRERARDGFDDTLLAATESARDAERCLVLGELAAELSMWTEEHPGEDQRLAFHLLDWIREHERRPE